MKKKITVLLVVLLASLLAVSCGKSKDGSGVPLSGDNAVIFINEYVKDHSVWDNDWINAHALLSDEFKKAFKEVVDKALAVDPEMPFDADPLLDSQDAPSQFKLVSADEKRSVVYLQGCNSSGKTYGPKLPVKMKVEKGQWLVSGVGLVNMEGALDDPDSPYSITAKNGLVMRDKPGVSGSKIATIPFGTRVTVVSTDGPELAIKGVKAPWYQVEYQGETGWAWSGYIKEKQ